MSRLAEAALRLERAVVRLETAIGRPGVSDEKKLAKALAEARAEYAALTEVTATVAARLDAAIGRLDRALER